MTLFPTMRSYMRASAVAGPFLWFVGFLLLAAGHLLMAPVPFVGALILCIAFPYHLPNKGIPSPPMEDDEKGVLGWVLTWARFYGTLTVLVWIFCQPEIAALQKRISDGGALWDWRLITPIAVWTICSSIRNWRHVSRISDTTIYSYFTEERSFFPFPQKLRPVSHKDGGGLHQ